MSSSIGLLTPAVIAISTMIGVVQHDSSLPVEVGSWRQSKGDLTSAMLLGITGDSYKQGNLMRGESAAITVLWWGCSHDDAGLCHGELDVRVVGPDGSIYLEKKGIQRSMHPTSPSSSSSLGSVELQVRPDAPIGRYTIGARVLDKQASVVLNLSRIVDVVLTRE